jgi:glycosyltransferase involved in cell wall biosynthesis
MPKVFIALATYQGEAYLSELLESIRRQSCRDWTLLVRDDGSCDATGRILRGAAEKDGRIVLVKDSGGRRGAAGNFGVLMQQAHDRDADYLFFADQDDVWHSDKVARQMQCILAADAEGEPDTPRLVYSDLVVVDALGQRVNSSFLRSNRLPQGETPLPTLLGRSFVLGCATVINRPLLDLAIPLPDCVASHDWWVALCAACAGRLSYLGSPAVDYRRHAGNTSLPAFWTSWNPLRHNWRRRWEAGSSAFGQSVAQARALRDRLRQRGMDGGESFDLLDRFCRVFDDLCSPGRRVGEFMRLGVPNVDLPRRLLYYACAMRLPRPTLG